MAKYQIILSSDENLTDQEITKIAEEFIATYERNVVFDIKFKVIYAQNLEGIKKELWEKKEELRKEINITSTINHQNEAIAESFEDIKKLFKLD